MQPAVEDDAEPDAASDPREDDVVIVMGDPRGTLGERGEVDVVLDQDGPAYVAAQRLHNADLPVRQVERVPDVAGLGVDHSWRADRQAPQLRHRYARPAGDLAHGAAHRGDRIRCVGWIDRQPSEKGARDVGDARGDLLRADVQAGNVARRRYDCIQRSARPPASRLRTDDVDEPTRLEPGQQLTRGDLRQARELSQTRLGERAGRQHQVDGRTVVELADQARGAGALRHVSGCSLRTAREMFSQTFLTVNEIASSLVIADSTGLRISWYCRFLRSEERRVGKGCEM